VSGHFGSNTLRHWDNSAPIHFGTDATGPKCPAAGAEVSV